MKTILLAATLLLASCAAPQFIPAELAIAEELCANNEGPAKVVKRTFLMFAVSQEITVHCNNGAVFHKRRSPEWPVPKLERIKPRT